MRQDANVRMVTFAVKEIDCNNCATGLESLLMSHVKGVMNISVNLLARRVAVSFDTTMVSDDDIKTSLQRIGVSVRYIAHAGELSQTMLKLESNDNVHARESVVSAFSK